MIYELKKKKSRRGGWRGVKESVKEGTGERVSPQRKWFSESSRHEAHVSVCAAKRVQACANLLFFASTSVAHLAIKSHTPASQTICILFLNELLLSFTTALHLSFHASFIYSLLRSPFHSSSSIIIHLTPSISAHLTLCRSSAACFSFIFPLHPSFSISGEKRRTHCHTLLACRRHPKRG